MLLNCLECLKEFESYNGLCKFCCVTCAIENKLVIDTDTPKLNEKHCKIWPITTNIGGYGQITYRGKTYKTHREIYKKYNGNIEKNKVIMHLCDNTKCNEILHLKKGTQKENIADMILKNRKVIQRGEEASKAKLTKEQAYDIKYNHIDKTNVDLAKMYNITATSISLIRRNINWKDI